jgi:hypothetical protein
MSLLVLVPATSTSFRRGDDERHVINEREVNYCPTGKKERHVYNISNKKIKRKNLRRRKFKQVSYMAYSAQTYRGSPVVW